MVRAASDIPDALLTQLRQATGQRYRIVKRLGSGGMADVYGAEHDALGRPLAIKVMHAHLARDAEMRERFRREAEAASRLVHPLVCTPLDYGEAGGTVFLVLPYLGGGSLAGLLVRDGRVAPGVAALAAAQVSSALDYAHRHGVIHRDVKPDNVLFDDDGNAVLTDFGIASARFHARLTAQGRAMGTPHYMSPEQAMGRLVDGRSDLYAVGVMLFECLAGALPFDHPDPFQVGHKHVHEPAPSLVARAPDVPAELAGIVMRCLAKDPGDRFERGRDLARALIAWLWGTGAADAAALPLAPGPGPAPTAS